MMPIAVHFIELCYIWMVVIFTIIYHRKGLPLIEGLFLLLIICSPYSISIIPFRQDSYELYGLYSNTNILNVLNFYKFFGLSVLDLYAIVIIIKNFKSAINIPQFFRIFYFSIVVVSIISYTLSSLLMWSSELDSVSRALSVMKSIVYIFSIYCVIERSCRCMGLSAFFMMLANIILIYCVMNAILLSFLPPWYTWVKYSFNYLFLDQTDQFIVFLYCTLALWGLKNNKRRYKLYALLLVMMLAISGGKGGIYSLLILGFSWLYQKMQTSSANLGALFICIMVISWILSYAIGLYELDVSIYTRYFQVKQLFINYENNLLLMIFGLGPSKAYLFYSQPAIFDPGAYTTEELSSNFKLAFQMPYLSWLKNFGLFGVCLLFVALNYVVKSAGCIRRTAMFSPAIVYSLGLYFVLVGFMDFPSFGLKTVIPISPYIYLIKCNMASNKTRPQ